MEKLQEQMDNIDTRSKVVENQVQELKHEAIKKKKSKDTRGALHCMKTVKMKEKELTKLDGMRTLVEQQRIMIECSYFDQAVYTGLDEG
mmetsp:Transcript_44701/g.43309  ORF Transcript_44701/g.43309 Transcript_44701/m.43309 type:complete len:89 (+) Transcript_44701:85-351(+)